MAGARGAMWASKCRHEAPHLCEYAGPVPSGEIIAQAMIAHAYQESMAPLDVSSLIPYCDLTLCCSFYPVVVL